MFDYPEWATWLDAHARWTKLSKRVLDLNGLSAAEQEVLGLFYTKYTGGPAWATFGSWWLAALRRAGVDLKSSVLLQVGTDLENRLGVSQGKLAPPDVRDQLADLIEERYGSRAEFCRRTGIDPGQLSRFFAGQGDLTLGRLEKALRTLDVRLSIEAA